MLADTDNFCNYSFEELKECRLCPRQCRVDRTVTASGFCCSDNSFSIAAIVPHFGEEPVISGKHGICNVFFSHCNLQCVFCQNHQISCNSCDTSAYSMNVESVIGKISECLDSGCHAVGFVSPSHMIPQLKIIVSMLHKAGRYPVIVYNSNGYDDVDSLKSLEGIIDVYLPDMKYMDDKIAGIYSGASDYPEKASAAIREMFRQKGSSLLKDENHQAISGLLIRHLILPGNVYNSTKVLSYIAENLSVDVHLSLMSQYYPVHKAFKYNELATILTKHEYDQVVKEIERLGFYRGWIQDLSSNEHYRPDFLSDNPF